MRLFSPLDSLVPRRTINDTNSVCWGGIGAGECLPGSDCVGIVYANQCLDTTGNECCLHRECSTPIGDGYCKNNQNQTCAGQFVSGVGPPWPCPGPNYMLCCVLWEDMQNGTSTTTRPPSTLATSTSTSTNGNSPSPSDSVPTSIPAAQESASSSTSTGLSAAQKGGVAGGIVGAAVVTGLVAFLVFFFLRRRRRRRDAKLLEREGEILRAAAGGGGSSDKEKERERGKEDMAYSHASNQGGGGGEEEEEEEDGGIAMLEGSMKQELDAQGRALHEMESPVEETRRYANADWGVGGGRRIMEEEKKPKGLAELPGSLTAVELPASGLDTTTPAAIETAMREAKKEG